MDMVRNWGDPVMQAIAHNGGVEGEPPAMFQSTSIELPTRAVGQGAPTALENSGNVAWMDPSLFEWLSGQQWFAETS